MALSGNGNANVNLGFDGHHPNCAKIPASLGYGSYQTSCCWTSGVAAAVGMGSFGNSNALNNGSSGAPLTAAAAMNSLNSSSSYCLDDLLTFPLHSNLDSAAMNGDPPPPTLVKMEPHQQRLLLNAMGMANPVPKIEEAKSNVEEPTPTSSQSKCETQSLKKRRTISNDSLPKSVASPGERDKQEDSKRKNSKASELGPGNKEDSSRQEAKQGAVAAKNEANSKQIQEKRKPSEPPKDYIHVRARRGQATDSHSLAERVRREKISERMKLLQDLVPGCNKITGKAVMLDEIINYVQSLQRQVEFLLMKLEAVNPRIELTADDFLPKDILEPTSMAFASDAGMAYPQFSQTEWSTMHVAASYETGQQFTANAAEVSAALKKSVNDKFPLINHFGDAKNPNIWDEELQNLFRSGATANINASFPAQNFHGSFPTTNANI